MQKLETRCKNKASTFLKQDGIHSQGTMLSTAFLYLRETKSWRWEGEGEEDREGGKSQSEDPCYRKGHG